MNARLWVGLFVVFAVFAAGCGADTSVTTDDQIEDQIETLRTNGDIPSLAAGIVIEDKLVWAKGFGDQPDVDTVYMIGSIDKVFMTTALLQLVEQGLIDLQADVGDYLPFAVRNPAFPDTPVTVELLLTHQAGLIGNFPDSFPYENDDASLEWTAENLGRDNSDSPFAAGRPSSSEYVESYFAPGGANAGTELWIGEPGVTWKYSNLAFYYLLASVIEAVTAQTWTAYVEEHIFDPVGMADSAFESSAFPDTRMAVPYVRFENGNRALPLTGMNASGRLRTTVPDLARFLIAHMNEGKSGDAEILRPESVALMHQEHKDIGGYDFGQLDFEGGALGWWLWTEGREGHNGNVPGFSAAMVMQETAAGTNGVILMINVGCSFRCDQDWYDTHFVTIREFLLEEARLATAPQGGD
jgi:CubicO group peptidase (beta-lactamase class C family)